MRTVTNIRFVPQEPNPLGNLRAFLTNSTRMSTYNWTQHKRIPVYKRNKKGNWINKPEPLNKVTLRNIFGTLHRLSSHSPDAVSAKWRQAAIRFERHHMPFVIGRTSVRWHNKMTAGGWL